MRDQIYRIGQETHNFRSYIDPGDQHCIIHRNELYSDDTNGDGSGVKLVDWIREMVDSDAPDSVACSGCEPEPLP